MRRIIFDNRAIGWNTEDVFNKVYLKTNIEYLVVKYNARGYLYLNEVHETFGIDWNPDDENVCFKKPQEITMWFEPIENEKYEIFIE